MMYFIQKTKIFGFILLSSIFMEQAYAIPAFPGAEGPGAETVGGRGGRIIEVTNLHESGPGSLREALEASGHRIVVFKIAGIIDLDGKPIYVKQPYLTVAGQTAPEGGITIKGQNIQIRTHDVVVRYIKVRTGTKAAISDQDGDAIGMFSNGDLYQNIIDHCSMSWANDENGEIWSKTKTVAPHHITYSWNIFSEGIDGHSCGFLAGASDASANDMKNISLHHNLFASNHHRNPMLKIREVKFINNLVYNWDYYATATTGGVRLDMIGNKYKPGPVTTSYRFQELIVKAQAEIADGSTGVDGEPEIYIRGNIGPNQTDEKGDNWGMITSFYDREAMDRNKFERISPLAKSTFPITIDSIIKAEQHILEKSGASKRINEKGEWVTNRDTVDTRIVNDYKNGTGSIPASEDDVGGYPTIHAGTPYTDSDHDGMADVWEDMYGFDKNDYNDNTEDKDGDGYTNLEEFINGTNPSGVAEEVNTAPLITLLGANPIYLDEGDTFVDSGAIAQDDKNGDITSSIKVSSNVNTSVAGTYHVTYTVSDSDGSSAEAVRSVIVSDGTLKLYTLQSRVSASSDDAEEHESGYMDLKSSDLELISDKDQQTIGIRFPNLDIPKSATITKAYIQFKVDENDFVADTRLTIEGEKTDSALSFTTETYNISSRSKTAASVSWSPARWSSVGEVGEDQRTSDLTSIVQEITSQSGWNTGNAMAFIITGEGKRVAETYNGDKAGAPMLYVEYTTADVGGEVTPLPVLDTTPPVLALLGSNPINLTVGEIFTDPGATAQDDSDGDLTDSIQSSDNVNVDVPGTYQVTYTVSDTNENTAEATRNVVVSDGTSELYTLESRVLASADDAEENADGVMYLNSSDLELIEDGSTQTVGIRFSGINIPQNASITKAYIQFKVDETDFVSNTVIRIEGEKGDNAPPFTKDTYNISSRTKTAASSSWLPAAWNSVGSAGDEQRTTDLTSIIQEIVSQSEWNSGNAMAFILTGNGKRVAESYDGDHSGAPSLYIEYSY